MSDKISTPTAELLRLIAEAITELLTDKTLHSEVVFAFARFRTLVSDRADAARLQDAGAVERAHSSVVERAAHNGLVEGSIPSAPTTRPPQPGEAAGQLVGEFGGNAIGGKLQPIPVPASAEVAKPIKHKTDCAINDALPGVVDDRDCSCGASYDALQSALTAQAARVEGLDKECDERNEECSRQTIRAVRAEAARDTLQAKVTAAGILASEFRDLIAESSPLTWSRDPIHNAEWQAKAHTLMHKWDALSSDPAAQKGETK